MTTWAPPGCTRWCGPTGGDRPATSGNERSGASASSEPRHAAITSALTVEDDGDRTWVSRGAHKIIGALDGFGIGVTGRRCLDAGASTGGFTEVLLDRGAREVVAVDVGYGQLAWSLRSDDRVVVIERTNIRDLTTPDTIGGPVDLAVAEEEIARLGAPS